MEIIRLLNENYEEISEADIEPEKGRIYTKNVIKPDADPVDDITKFAYADDDYEEVMIYERLSEEVIMKKHIEELKRKLTDTDYVVIKIAEGVSTADEYAGVISARQEWRDEINSYEKKLKEL